MEGIVWFFGFLGFIALVVFLIVKLAMLIIKAVKKKPQAKSINIAVPPPTSKAKRPDAVAESEFQTKPIQSSTPIKSNTSNSIEEIDHTFYKNLITEADFSDEAFMADLEDLILTEDKKLVREFIQEHKEMGVFLPDKVYAKAMSFLDGRKWLSDEEFQEKQRKEQAKIDAYYEEEDLFCSLVAKQIDILLDKEATTEEQTDAIKQLHKPYSRRRKYLHALNKHSYWHALHIIMNSDKVPAEVAQEARKERMRSMRAMTERRITEFPIFDIKRLTSDACVELTHADAVEFQNFARINGERGF